VLGSLHNPAYKSSNLDDRLSNENQQLRAAAGAARRTMYIIDNVLMSMLNFEGIHQIPISRQINNSSTLTLIALRRAITTLLRTVCRAGWRRGRRRGVGRRSKEVKRLAKEEEARRRKTNEGRKEARRPSRRRAERPPTATIESSPLSNTS